MDSNRHIKLDSGSFLSEIMHKNHGCTFSLIAYCVVMICGALIKSFTYTNGIKNDFNKEMLICECVVSAMFLLSTFIVYFGIKDNKNGIKLRVPIMLIQGAVILLDTWLTYVYLSKCFSADVLGAHFSESFFYFACAVYVFLNLLSATFVLSFLKSSVIRKHASHALQLVSYLGVAVCFFEFLSYIISLFYSKKADAEFLTANFGDILRFGIAPLLFCSFWVILRYASNKIQSVFAEVEEAFSEFEPLCEECEDDSDVKIAKFNTRDNIAAAADKQDVPELVLDAEQLVEETEEERVETIEVEDEPVTEEEVITEEIVPEEMTEAEQESITDTESDTGAQTETVVEEEFEETESECAEDDGSIDLMAGFAANSAVGAVWADEIVDIDEEDDEEFEELFKKNSMEVTFDDVEEDESDYSYELDDSYETDDSETVAEEEFIEEAAEEIEISDGEPAIEPYVLEDGIDDANVEIVHAMEKKTKKSDFGKKLIKVLGIIGGALAAVCIAFGKAIMFICRKIAKYFVPLTKKFFTILWYRLKILNANISAKFYMLVLLVNYEGKIPKRKEESCEKERVARIARAQKKIKAAKAEYKKCIKGTAAVNAVEESKKPEADVNEAPKKTEARIKELSEKTETVEVSEFPDEPEFSEPSEVPKVHAEPVEDILEEEIPASKPVNDTHVGASGSENHGRKYRKKR